MRTCAVCDADIADHVDRCPSCDAPATQVRRVVDDEAHLPDDLRREIDDARRQLLIPRPVERGMKTIVLDAARAFLVACGGLLLAMIVAWFAFRVL